jgi:two-component system, response regulator PdtaR
MSNTKVLVVEDESIVALEIQDRLTMMGYHVCGLALSGEKAINLARTTSPSLVLMDIKLKGDMDGIEAAKTIKEEFNTPSIFITAFSDESTMQEIKEFFNYEYLLKPFEEEELKRAIEATLSKFHRSSF